MKTLAVFISILTALNMTAVTGSAQEVRVTILRQPDPLAGQLVRVDAQNLFHLILNGGQTTSVPGQKIVTITFPSRPVPGGPIHLELVGGDSLFGTVAGENEMGVDFQTASFGRMVIPLERIRLLERPTAMAELQEKPLLAPSGGKDVVFRRLKDNVDRVQGTVDLVRPGGVVLASNLGDLDFDFDQLVAVAFAAPDTVHPIPGLHAIAQGTDGGRLTGTLTGNGPGKLVLKTPHGFEVALAGNHVQSIYFRGGDLVYVSDLDPVRVEERSYFPGRVWKHRRDRTVTGHPLTLNGVDYPKGLGVHAFSALTYRLDGRYSRFQSLIGIDDEVRTLSARGAVVFRVLLDNKEAFKSPILRGMEPPHRIQDLDVTGVKEMTLEVDFGDDSHAGDRADWAMAILVKKKA